MSATLLPNPRQQYFGNDGNPLAGGKLYTYAVGTSTPKVTYADAAGLVPNPNPVILDSRGEATIFWDGTYKVVLNDSLDGFVYSQDSYPGYDLSAADGSSKIGYTQGGSGATVRTVQSKLREVVTPYDFGAVGDGVTDDTAAVQAALNTSALQVYLAAGRFRLTSTVTSTVNNRTINGPGILTATTTEFETALTVMGNYNTISVNIDGNNKIARGVYFDSAVLPVVDGGILRNFYSSANLLNCAALYFYKTQAGAVVRGVTIDSVNSVGDSTGGASPGYSRGIAVVLRDGNPTGDFLIDGCHISNIIGEEGDAIAAGSSDANGTYFRLDLTVQRCTIRGFTRRAVKTQGDHVRVIGNAISNDWTSAAQVPRASNVIDFVQGGNCVARDNDLYNCNFFTQLSVYAVAGEVVNNFFISNNTFTGLLPATANTIVSATLAGSAAVTFTNGSANIASSDNYLPKIGAAVTFTTSGTLPTNFATGTTYYVVSRTFVDPVYTITVSATPGGGAIVAGSAGTGAHALTGALTSTGLVIRDNVILGGTGRAFAIGKCDNPIIEGNSITVDDEASTQTISFTSGVRGAIAANNILVSGARQSFIANYGTNGVHTNNHVKSSTPMFSNPTGSGNHLVLGNSIDGTASLIVDASTNTGNRYGGNYNFGSQVITPPGPLFSAAGSTTPTPLLTGLYVATGQIVFDTTPTASGKIGWTAINAGLVAPAWTISTAYTVGTYVSNGANTYICTTAGTSAGAGGPTGTAGTPVADGTAAWLYVAASVTWKQFGPIDA